MRLPPVSISTGRVNRSFNWPREHEGGRAYVERDGTRSVREEKVAMKKPMHLFDDNSKTLSSEWTSKVVQWSSGMKLVQWTYKARDLTRWKMTWFSKYAFSAVSDRYGFFPSSHSEVKSGVKVQRHSTWIGTISRMIGGMRYGYRKCAADSLAYFLFDEFTSRVRC